jgi:hypothetical protein
MPNSLDQGLRDGGSMGRYPYWYLKFATNAKQKMLV